MQGTGNYQQHIPLLYYGSLSPHAHTTSFIFTHSLNFLQLVQKMKLQPRVHLIWFYWSSYYTSNKQEWKTIKHALVYVMEILRQNACCRRKQHNYVYLHALDGCFVFHEQLQKRFVRNWPSARKQTIQRSFTNTPADFSKLNKKRACFDTRIIKNTKFDTVIAAYQLYKSRRREIEFVRMALRE